MKNIKRIGALLGALFFGLYNTCIADLIIPRNEIIGDNSIAEDTAISSSFPMTEFIIGLVIVVAIVALTVIVVKVTSKNSSK